MKTYAELITLKTFEERFKYLQTLSYVGDQKFGSYRYWNQKLYMSTLWKVTRRKVILRDNACDLAMPGHDIYTTITIHHINPITIEQLIEGDPMVFDLNNLVCVSTETHRAIHYSDLDSIEKPWSERKAGDTKLW